ncbi:MAG TPA: hypothetical protein VEL07_08935 [Planctomycetota bacterium]|nr:hypothetical protein [Planctomycetota bacterium]
MAKQIFLALGLTALMGACGGGGGGSSQASPTTPGDTRMVTTYHDPDQRRIASRGAVKVDAAGANQIRDGEPVRVGQWTWHYDAAASPMSRVERFDDSGASVRWTVYNSDGVDPTTGAGSVRDDSRDAVP